MPTVPRSTAQLRQLASDLPARYTAPLAHLARARILSGGQLDRLLIEDGASSQTTGRVRRRIMTRLAQAGLVATLDRRVGGVRAGSAGHVYTLTSTGHRLHNLLNGRESLPRERAARAPGAAFLAHALAISDIYVSLIEHSRAGRFTLARFQTEPSTWWPTSNGTQLRPDAYVVLHATAHVDCWWLEIDNNTESLPRIRDKIRAYREFFIHAGTGPDNVPPRILFTGPEQNRVTKIHQEIMRELTEAGALIAAATHHGAAEYLITELRKT